jgi:hypothetical protein
MALYRRMCRWEEAQGSDKQVEDVDINIGASELKPNESLVKRARATEEYIANVAASESLVYDFRQRFLGGGVITPNQGQRLVSSPAAAILPSSYFAASGPVRIPVDHNVVDCELTPYELGDDEDILDPYTSPSELYDGEGAFRPVRMFVDPPGKELTAKTRYWQDLHVPDENGRSKAILVELSSLLGSLLAVCNSLLERRLYPWREHQAAWFVITGEPPTVPALVGGYRTSSNPAITEHTITMRVKPWVPAETVRRLYRRLQERVLEDRPRSLSERNLAVFRFVVEQTEVWGVEVGDSEAGPAQPTKPKLVQPAWRTLLDLWNRRYPEGHDWHYGDVRNLRRDFGRAERAIVHPRYKAQDGN